MTDKDAHSLGGSLRGHLLCQPGLTDARLAGDRSQPTTAGDGAVGKPTQKVTFRLSAYEGGALPGLVLHDLSIIPPAVTDRLRAQGNDRQDRALPPAEHKVWDGGPRLTILLDPARIKPDLAAHRQVGHRCATAAVPVRGRQPDPRCQDPTPGLG